MSAALQFPGGPVALHKPSREALLLSARQWLSALAGELHELTALPIGQDEARVIAAMQGQLSHVKRILAELEGVL